MGSKEDRALNELTREITVFREVNGHYRRSDEKHKVRVFSVEQLRRLLEEAGFSVSVSDCYGEYQLANRRQAFIATRD